MPGALGGKAGSGEEGAGYGSPATPRQCAVCQVKVWGFYPKCNGKPVKGFQPGSDTILKSF